MRCDVKGEGCLPLIRPNPYAVTMNHDLDRNRRPLLFD
jgi:hypothetical protein